MTHDRIILSKPVIYSKPKRAGVHFFIHQGGTFRVPKFRCRIINFDKENENCKNYKAPFYRACRDKQDEEFKSELKSLEDDIYDQLKKYRETEKDFRDFHPTLSLEKGSFFIPYRGGMNIPIGLYTKQRIKKGNVTKNENISGIAKTRNMAPRPASALEGKEGCIVLHAKLGSIFVYEKENKLCYYLKLHLESDEFQFKEDVPSSKQHEKEDEADLYSEEEISGDEEDGVSSLNGDGHLSPVLPVDVTSNSDYHEVL